MVRRPELYFFRDTNGNEVDLIIKSQRELIPVEIKSAATFTPHFIKGIERFRQAAGDRCRQGHVLYGGEKSLTFKGVRINNPFLSGEFI